MRYQMQKIENHSAWRNQKIDVMVNLKKWMYKLQPQTLIQNKNLETWLLDTLRYRRKKFMF